MSHKEIVKSFLSMIVEGSIQQAFDTYVGELFVHHNQYTKPGKEGLIEGMQNNHGAFPDKQFTIDMMIEENDLVMTYSLMKFTPDHAGLRVVHICRFENDKIVELWDAAMQLIENPTSEM